MEVNKRKSSFGVQCKGFSKDFVKIILTLENKKSICFFFTHSKSTEKVSHGSKPLLIFLTLEFITMYIKIYELKFKGGLKISILYIKVYSVHKVSKEQKFGFFHTFTIWVRCVK
jgi:hypothetical protein